MEESQFKSWLIRCNDTTFIDYMKHVNHFYIASEIGFGIFAMFWGFMWRSSDFNPLIGFFIVLKTFMVFVAFGKHRHFLRDIPEILEEREKWRNYKAQFSGKDN